MATNRSPTTLKAGGSAHAPRLKPQQTLDIADERKMHFRILMRCYE
jgi:hypothetical protein